MPLKNNASRQLTLELVQAAFAPLIPVDPASVQSGH